MAIVIEGQEGPHKGQWTEFDNDKDKITFGRQPKSDFQFPPDMTSISRFHLTLEFVNDRYRISMQRDNPVFLNGKEAVPGDELPLGESVIQLGTKDGPKYRMVAKESFAELPKTDASYKAQKSSMDVARGTRRKLSAAVAIVIIAIAGIIYFQMRQAEQQERLMASINAAVSDFDSKYEQLDAPDFSSIVQQNAPSVYLVAMRAPDGALTSLGTAWSVAPGTVATNAHVAVNFPEIMERGSDMVLVSNQPPHNQLLINDVQIHPHYQAFQTTLDQSDRFTESGQQLDLVAAYDVALMYVAAEHEDNLAPPLTLATDEELQDMSAGGEIAFIGYPAELAVGGGHNPRAPVPTTQVARITAVTDFFLTDSGFGRNHLLQHSLPSHGGASGSPIFNEEGHVISALSAGNVAFVNGMRIGTGIGVNFGQRADLIRELLNGTTDDVRPERVAYWQEKLSTYRGLLDTLVSGWQAEMDGEREVLSTERGMLAANAGAGDTPVWRTQVSFNQAGPHLLVAVPDQRADIDLYLLDGQGNIINQDTEANHYPNLSYNLDSPAQGTFYVIVAGPREGIEFNFQHLHLE